MPCKMGFRKNIEESKAFYKTQKEYDPHQELWRSLVDRVHNTPGGFGTLNDDEMTYFAIGCLMGEVYNGGFHQFFTNSSGDLYGQAVFGLRKLNATNAHRLLQRSAAILFENVVPPTDQIKDVYPVTLPPLAATRSMQRVSVLDNRWFNRHCHGLHATARAFSAPHGRNS